MMLILEFIPLQEDDLNDILSSLPSKMLKNYKGTPRRPLSQIIPDADPFGKLDIKEVYFRFHHLIMCIDSIHVATILRLKQGLGGRAQLPLAYIDIDHFRITAIWPGDRIRRPEHPTENKVRRCSCDESV